MFYLKTVFIILFLAVAKAEEPHCSKYDFEEKVLEKMVRMEFQMERMNSDVAESITTIENMKNQVDAALREVDQKVAALENSMENNFAELENTITEELNGTILELEAIGGNTRKDVDDSLAVVDKKVSELENNIENNFSALQNKMTETLNRKLQELEAIADKTITPTVAFKARMVSSTGVSSGLTIVFPGTLFNEGEAYNPGSGIFTTPVNGTYMFSIAFCVYNAKTLVTGIMVDGTKHSVTLFYGDANYGCNTADTIAVLRAGQRVWVQVLPASTTSGTIINHAGKYRWNTFSGALIHQ